MRVCLVRSELTNLEVQYLIILLSIKLNGACIFGKSSIAKIEIEGNDLLGERNGFLDCLD